MTYSMTAFARQDVVLEAGQLSLELRSVNHRYLELNLRLPEELRNMETMIREQINQHLKRGKVEVNLRLKKQEQAAQTIQLNHGIASSLLDAVQLLQQSNRQTNFSKTNALEVLRWPGVVQENEIDLNPLQQAVKQLFNEGLTALLEARRREGDQLAKTIRTRLQTMRDQVKQVQHIYPDILQALRDKLNQRLSDLDLPTNSERLEQELVLQAQRLDVAEEIDRLNTHIHEIEAILDRDEPVGRRLDFLVQELNREANTLASKSNTTQSTQIAVELKVLIEQIREQVQNIE